MKRLLLAFLMLLTCFGMTSCSSFFGEEEALVITSVRREVGKNEKGEDGFYIIIEYANEYKSVDKFFVPNGKKGETGLEGNGIKEIKTSVNEENKETVVTIIFTDETMEPVEYTVPLGTSLKGVVATPNEDGSSNVEFEFSDGTKSDPITLPKGEKGDGFEGYQINDNEDGSRELLLKFTNHDAISVIIPQGKEGNGIDTMFAYTNDLNYVIEVHYTNGEKQRLKFDKPSSWITGSYAPGEIDGNDGDFFFDTTHKVIYSKEGGVWTEVVALDSTVPQMCTVRFEVNDTPAEPAVFKGQKVMQVKEGTYFGMGGQKELPEPSREGYTFDGWYLKKDPTLVNGRFTDTTPVFGDITLYANWIKSPEAQA